MPVARDRILCLYALLGARGGNKIQTEHRGCCSVMQSTWIIRVLPLREVVTNVKLEAVVFLFFPQLMTLSFTVGQNTYPVLYCTNWRFQNSSVCLQRYGYEKFQMSERILKVLVRLFLTVTFPNVDILFIFCMETFLLYVLMCHCHNPFGCSDTDSTSSLPCWLECFIELCSVWALDLKCEASVHSKPTMSGVSCLPPRSLAPLYFSSSLPLSLPR